jgi:mannitol/fructose-specific phosphotransferase system IIA component (Ntr-type)/nitrogen regulatory protein PII
MGGTHGHAIALEDLLVPELIRLDVQVKSPKQIYEAVAKSLVEQGFLPASDQAEAVKGLVAREKLGGIALGRGVAIPHCTMPSLDKPRVAVIRLSDGLKLKSPDNVPVDLWFVLTGAKGDVRAHLQALARLALLLRDDQGLAGIRAAVDPAGVMAAALKLEDAHPLTPAKPGAQKRLLVIVLNETGRLHEVIEGLAEIGVSGATVIESRGMGRIISQDIPIFAGFRHLLGGSQPFNYTIYSVVPDAEIAHEAVTMLRDTLSGADGTPGIAFTLPVEDFQRLTQVEPEDEAEPSAAPAPSE